MRTAVTNKVSFVKDGQEVATAHIEQLPHDNQHLLVWDGVWVKCLPTELEAKHGTKGAKTLITALHTLATENNLRIQVRHPQDWKEFKQSLEKLSILLGVEFVEHK